MTRQRVLFITTDPLTDAMPGPAIRAWNLAATLSGGHDVVLVSSVACSRSHPHMEVAFADPRTVEELCDWMTVLVGPGSVVTRYPCAAATDKPVVIDIYDPYHLENLAMQATTSERGDETIRELVQVVNRDLARGDFFLCASERQRDFWLGSLTALGRVNARTHERDPGLERLLAVVPFGVPADPPVREGPGLKDVLPVGRAPWPVVLWGGGVYDWLDPGTVLRAVHQLRAELPDIFLVFMGMGHPNPEIPEMPAAKELRALADALELTPSNVAFNASWVPYEQRGAALLDATVGVSTHLEHLEARFSFRTRVLDYLWAGLPTVMTRGDVLSQLIEDMGAGVAVRPGDVDAVADGIRKMATSPPPREAVRALGQQFRWDRVAAPLLEYCAHPWRAADRPRSASGPANGDPTTTSLADAHHLSSDVRSTVRNLVRAAWHTSFRRTR
jgi:glycosyltransferase involved in cell wall biosynthesis